MPSFNPNYVNTHEYELTGEAQTLRFRDPEITEEDGEGKIIFTRRQFVVSYRATCIICHQSFEAVGVPGKKRKVCDNPVCAKTYNRARVWLHRNKLSTGDVTEEQITRYHNRKVIRKDPRSGG